MSSKNTNRNFVAKYAKQFNKAAVFKDKKKEVKKTGYRYQLDDDFYDDANGFPEDIK